MSFSMRKSDDKLDLSCWELPDIIVKKYEEIGIKRMFKWQAECLMIGSGLGNR
jgi:DNA polymerase theta